MQHMKKEYFEKIEGFIDFYYFNNGIAPTNIEILRGTDLSTATVSRYVSKMCENGLLTSNGHRNIKTKKISNYVSDYANIPVWDNIPDNISALFQNKSSKSIAVSRNLIGEDEYCIIQNLTNTENYCEVRKGDYIIVRKQKPDNLNCLVASINGNKLELSNFKELNSDNGKKQSHIIFLGVVVKVVKSII